MTPALKKGIAVAAIHVSIVASLGAKLVVDRATRPRVWVRTAPADPNLPIRGRYVRLRIEADPDADTRPLFPLEVFRVRLSVRRDRLVATRVADGHAIPARYVIQDGEGRVVVEEPVAFFIPEHATDPSVRKPGEELWVEVTIPRAGPPRPIRLGVKRSGILTPLEVR